MGEGGEAKKQNSKLGKERRERVKGRAEAEFKEFEPRLKFKTRLKNGLFHLKLY